MLFQQEQIHRFTLAAVGLVQGVVFWIVIKFWPETTHAVAVVVALLFFVSICGLIIQLAWTGYNKQRVIAVAAVIAGLLALISLWVWWQIPAKGASFAGDDYRQFTLIPACIIALYILLPFIQIFQLDGRLTFPYTALFRHSWNNFYIIVIGLLFAGIFWGLIGLWAGLFSMIGIALFKDIFFSTPFISITLPAMFGYGIALGKDNEKIINTLLRISFAVYRTLTPLLAFIALLFLVVLPFTGLQPLWNTKFASPLLLTLLALIILFVNAVFQDGETDVPYPKWVRYGIDGMLLAMPVFSGICLYSVYLRIDQYGLMPDRFYVIIFALITGLYGIGYSFAALKQSNVWIGLIRPINIGISLFVASIALLIHTSALGPLSWSAKNQYERLLQGRADAKDFDYGALRFKLGHVGSAKLNDLAKLNSHPQAEIIRSKVDMVNRASSYYDFQNSASPVFTVEQLNVFTPSGRLPDGLIETIASEFKYMIGDCMKEKKCAVISMNLDNDSQDEYLFVPPGKYHLIYLYDQDKNQMWHREGSYEFKSGSMPDRARIIEAIRKSKVKAIEAEYKDFKIGEWVFIKRAW